MKKQLRAAAFLVAILFTAVFLLSACQSETKEAEALPKLVIGSDYYEPYTYIDNNGKLTGVNIEIATEACRRIGYEPVFKQVDRHKRQTLLDSGEVDCLWGSFSMNGKENDYLWAGPYLNSYQVAAVRSGSNLYRLSDIENRNVSAQFGSRAAEMLLNGSLDFAPKNVYCFATISEVFVAMSNGYADACVGHETALMSLIGDNTDEYRILETPLFVADLGVAFSKDETEFPVEKLSEALDGMKKDGTIKDIVIKYGLDPEKALN